MSQSALPKLFAALERAGMEYARLHRMLTAFFTARGCGSDSEALADVTLLDRLARKVDEGEVIDNFIAYTKAVARRVFKEYCKNREKFREAMRELAYLRKADVQESGEEPDLRRKCQASCIGELSKSEQQLMVDYYVRGADRGALAEELGCVLGNLRLRIHRLKLRLKECVEKCLRRA